MKNSKSKPGNRKSWKNIYEIFSSVPAMFDFVQDSTNELERKYFKKQDIKWIVKNTFISFAGIGILSVMFMSCEKREPVTPGFSMSDRQEKASAFKVGQSVMIAVNVPDLITEGSAVWQFDKQTIGAIFVSDDAPGNDAGCPNVSVAAV